MNITFLDPTELPLKKTNPFKVPYFLESVSAGFPSPAQDFVERRLDVNDL